MQAFWDGLNVLIVGMIVDEYVAGVKWRIPGGWTLRPSGIP